ncbi:MAG: phosphoadenylyl-sulfate reductase [Bacteroidales bacterium]|nr:phosphoadenylyl-sulfate reductase [Bacteroidales bacterium]
MSKNFILSKENIESLNEQFRDADPIHLLDSLCRPHKNRIVFSSSMGAEDQVITDMIVRLDLPVRIFTLDTGRLFPETYELISKTCSHYNIKIDILFPDFHSIEKMVSEKGINLFYENRDNRILCCHLRKVEPFKRALAGFEVCITGIRKDQTLERFNKSLIEWDEKHELIKVNLLLKWTEKKVWEYIHKYNVPYNKLHDMGFPSIGCQPCTRAVTNGDDPRSGRWWWEDQGQKECGLHLKDE